MKKIIMILLIAGLMLSISPVFAQPTVGFPMASKVLTASTALVIPAGKEIYGYTLWTTTAATGNFGLYDCKTLVATSASNVMVEDAEATDEDSVTVWFPKPLIVENGGTVVLNAGILTIYYQK